MKRDTPLRAELESLLATLPRAAGATAAGSASAVTSTAADAAAHARRRAFLGEAEARLGEVHRRELARLPFVEGQLLLARTDARERGLCGLDAVDALAAEADARRARVERAAELGRGAGPGPRPEAAPGLDAAAALFERSLELESDGAVRAALALVLALDGRPDRALRLLDEPHAHATPRAASRTWEAAACAHDRRGRPTDAARAYARAAEADPTNEAAGLFALYFALEHADGRECERAAARLDELPSLGREGRDVIELQRRSLVSGAWRPTSECLRRVERLRSDARPHLDHALLPLVP